MTTPLLALFSRSLREDVRGAATYWVKAGLGLFMLFIVAGVALSSRWSGAPGRGFFISIVSLQMLAISFIGLAYFASAVAEEKEEQTLGLLRMTNLDPLSILLGKSTSRLCGALLLLAAQFPFTIFAVTLGGISLGQIAATYCTLAAYTFLLCNVALLGSVLARRTAGAAVFTVLVLGSMMIAGPLLGVLDKGFVKLGIRTVRLDALGDWLWATTPIARLIEVLGTGFAAGVVGWQVVSNLALGVGFFMLAWLAFERFCDQASVEAVASGPVSRPTVGIRLGRPPRPIKHALVWKDFHFMCGGRMGLIVRIACYIGLPLALSVLGGKITVSGGAGVRTGFAAFVSVVTFAFSIDAAAMAARMFRREINDQTLSTLALLPCTMRELAYRKATACLIAAVPGLLMIVGGSVVAWLYLEQMSGTPAISAMMIPQTLAGWINVIFLVHVVAWLSLYMKRGALPVGYVLTQAVGIVVSIVFMSIAMTALFTSWFSGGMNNTSFVFLSPLAIALVNLIATWLLHRHCLRRLEVVVGEN